MQQPLHFGVGGVAMRTANSFPCDVAGQLVQVESEGEALLASHLAIELDLLLLCLCCCHTISIRQILAVSRKDSSGSR